MKKNILRILKAEEKAKTRLKIRLMINQDRAFQNHKIAKCILITALMRWPGNKNAYSRIFTARRVEARTNIAQLNKININCRKYSSKMRDSLLQGNKIQKIQIVRI